MGSDQSGRTLVSGLHILQLILVQTKVVTQLVDDGPADLLADFALVGANGFNVLLVKHNVVGTRGQFEAAPLCLGHAVEETEKQPSLPLRLHRWLVRGKVFHENSHVTDATAELSRKRI